MAKSSPKNAIFDRARMQFEAQMKQGDGEHRRALVKKRLEFVNAGVKAYHEKKLTEAVINYQSYIKLLEDWKGVGEGGLTLSCFDMTRELGDVLMLTGIYWDLTKLFDRTQSPDKKRIFLHYLEKYIAFSKGTSWQPLCAEQLRRYLSREKPVHREEFKNAYKMIGDGKCFVVTSLLDVTEFETLPTLWGFRDEVLSRTLPGRVFIRVYYRVGPFVAAVIDLLPLNIRKGIGRALDGFSQRIRTRLP